MDYTECKQRWPEIHGEPRIVDIEDPSGNLAIRPTDFLLLYDKGEVMCGEEYFDYDTEEADLPVPSSNRLLKKRPKYPFGGRKRRSISISKDLSSSLPAILEQ